jgi:hypothetical protein
MPEHAVPGSDEDGFERLLPGEPQFAGIERGHRGVAAPWACGG